MEQLPIEEVIGRKVFDSRGSETIEAEVWTRESVGRAIAPSGKSIGRNEVRAFPKGGVSEALAKLKKDVSRVLKGKNSLNQEEIDSAILRVDGTEDLSSIGGSLAFAVSMANLEAASNYWETPIYKYLGGIRARELPYPLGNVVGGGSHTMWGADIQEFLVLPTGAEDIYQALETNIEIHRLVGEELKKLDKTFTGGKGDEGAWAPNLKSNEILEVMSKICENYEKDVGMEVRLGIDLAASSLWNGKHYHYKREGIKRSPEEQMEYVISLIDEYGVKYIEDPFHEEDFDSFSTLTEEKGKEVLICGDDLFTTNKERLETGMKRGACNSLIIKVNQVGVLSKALETLEVAMSSGYIPIISHRSGESCDPKISHLAVGLRIPIAKIGILGGERVSKANELIRIWEDLGSPKMVELPKQLR